MPKTTGALFSLNARGSLAKTIVYSRWRGIPYARQHVVPANPKTTPQNITRSVFTFLSRLWAFLPGPFQAAFTAGAAGRPLTNRNLLVKLNLFNLRDSGNLAFLALSPVGGAAPSPTGAAAAVIVNDISVSWDPPATPTGWLFVAAHAVAFSTADPTAQAFDDLIEYGTDAGAGPIVLVGAHAAIAAARVALMFEFTDAPGATRYSAAVNVFAA